MGPCGPAVPGWPGGDPGGPRGGPEGGPNGGRNAIRCTPYLKWANAVYSGMKSSDWTEA